ncbi:MAG: sigma-70 family RNA polymerase sigma factor [Paracoccaceae bacterium]
MTDCHPFTKLLPEQRPVLYRRAMRLTVNPHRAEDLVQATLLKAWIHRDRFELETNLRAWLFTIMRNTFLSELRKHRLEVEDSEDTLALTVAEEARQDHALALKELLVAVASLPDAQREPLLMMGYYGFSQLETADACGCTLGTVKSRVSRGRATLNRMLAHDEVEASKDRTTLASCSQLSRLQHVADRPMWSGAALTKGPVEQRQSRLSGQI